MPVYDYRCPDGHTTESRQGIEQTSIPCPVCKGTAARAQVYRDQYMQAETGPVGGKKNEVPPSDIRLGQEVSEFVEASEQVAEAYNKAEAETGKAIPTPPLFKRGMAQAQRLKRQKQKK